MHWEVDWEQRIDWAPIREYRTRRLTEAIRARGLDGMLLTKLDALRYALSFRGVTSIWFQGTRYVLLLDADGGYRFLVASGDHDRVLRTMPWIPHERVVPFPLEMSAGVDLVVDGLRALGLADGRIGVDLAPYTLFEPLQERVGARFVNGQPVLDAARAIKHPEEVKVLRRAAQVADAGMQTGLDMLRPGVSEVEVSNAISQAMFAEGCEDITHRSLVESGPNSWLGYRFPTDRRMQNGEMVYIDCGSAIVNGYAGDIARVSVVGEPTREQSDVYSHMVDMLEAGTAALKPGATTTSVADAVKAAVGGTPFEDRTYFGIIGHGIGTDMHEPPVIGDRVAAEEEDATIEAGMVVCLEPGILVPGVGGGHVENMVLVGEDGPESLTRTAYDAALLAGS
jgi:Xaa-Pro aminopeptidase